MRRLSDLELAGDVRSAMPADKHFQHHLCCLNIMTLHKSLLPAVSWSRRVIFIQENVQPYSRMFFDNQPQMHAYIAFCLCQAASNHRAIHARLGVQSQNPGHSEVRDVRGALQHVEGTWLCCTVYTFAAHATTGIFYSPCNPAVIVQEVTLQLIDLPRHAILVRS